MEPMFLPDVEKKDSAGPYGEMIRKMRAAGATIPQIFFNFAFKPEAGKHLSRYTQEVMRGDSPLPPGIRELIAAFTSKVNHCPF
jgi:alkylhydroperoxidase family enzyme